MREQLSTSSDPIREIVERSAFLDERLGSDFRPETQAGASDLIINRIDAWRRNCARGDEKVFSKRLGWDGLDLDLARLLAGRVRHTNPELPRWARALGPMIESSRKPWEEMKNDLGSTRGEQPLAFEEFLFPFLQVARATLQKERGNTCNLLAGPAHRQWELSLLVSWTAIAAATLDQEFTRFRADRGNSTLSPSPSRELYESFLSSLKGEGLLALFLEYPVLARYLAVTLCQWVDAAGEFLLRLEADLPELESRFNKGQPLGLCVKLDPDLSDPHRGGRTALRVHFAGGLRLIYKAKAIGAESAWWNLLGWVNRNAGLPQFRTLHVLDREAYGWVEEAKPRPCRDQREVQTYYHRAGMLLCLVYALEGADCHQDNLVAAGEHPVLIDHETLLQARIRYFGPPGEEGALVLAGRRFYEDSVFRTALLPRWEIRASGESYDVSGLGGSEIQQTHRQRKVWENINTDAMRLRTEPISIQPAHNVVMLDGRKINAAHYVENIGAGFEQMYRFLRWSGAGMLSPEGPLHKWLGLRFVFRDTAIYDSMIKRLRFPRYLRDGMDASVALEIFTRPLLYAEERPFNWPILAAERNSLLQGDIPIFNYAAEDDGLLLEGGGNIRQFFRESAFAQVQRTFASLSEEDLSRQLSFLRASFELSGGELSGGGPRIADGGRPAASKVPEEGKAHPDDFLSEALRIAHQIREGVRSFKDGASWITVAYHAAAQRWQLEPMSTRFYDGLCGVAVFLAAVHQRTGDPDSAALARSALGTVVREGRRPDYVRSLFEPGIGAATGQSSLVYSLVRASEFLGEEEWLDHARSFAAMLDAGHIGADRKFDLISGAAGAILALLALYRTARLPEVLDKAVLCGKHLTGHRSASPQGPRAWKTLREETLTGFSHGAAGIAYALLKLFEATGEKAFRDAAVEAEAYESCVFLPEVSNWPTFAGPSAGREPVVKKSWCHGAPGIVLSRLAALPILDNPQVRQDISRGLETTRSAGTEGLDTVCCGAMGRIEVLLVATRELGDPDYLHEARQMASTILRRSQLRGRYELGWENVPFLASFHQGMAGIGYEFLRLDAPASLPSLLLWE